MAHGGQDMVIRGGNFNSIQANHLILYNPQINYLYAINQGGNGDANPNEEDLRNRSNPRPESDAPDDASGRTESDRIVAQGFIEDEKALEKSLSESEQNFDRSGKVTPDADSAQSTSKDKKTGSCFNLVSIFKSRSKQKKDDFKINKEDKKKIKSLKHKLTKPLEKLGYVKAVEYACEIQKLQRQNNLECLLLIAECEAHLDRGQIEESIGKIKELILKEKDNPSLEARNQGYEMKRNNKYVRAMILYKIWHDFTQSQKTSSRDKMKLISHQVACIANAIQPLITSGDSSRKIALNYGMEYIKSMLNNLRKMEIDDQVRLLTAMSCLVNLTGISNQLGDFDTSIKYGEDGLSKFEHEFSENSVKYQHYGWLVHNLGNSYFNSKKYAESVKMFEKAVDAKEKCLESRNEEEIQLSKRNLEIAREALEKKTKCSD